MKAATPTTSRTTHKKIMTEEERDYQVLMSRRNDKKLSFGKKFIQA